MTEAPILKKSPHWFLYDKELRHERVKCWLPITVFEKLTEKLDKGEYCGNLFLASLKAFETLRLTETHPEPCPTSELECFPKFVKSYILDI